MKDGLLKADKSSSCGWILDLRDNGGGNMWPMMKGLDPLLGDAPFGSFVLADRFRQPWRRGGANIFPHSGELPPSPPAFTLHNSAAPIAILIGPMTVSSGEMVAIAPIGRENVRVFGTASAGFTTANMTHKLKDGAVLAVTVSGVADRTGRYYSGPIEPDERSELAFTEAAATKWLLDRCRAPEGAATEP